MRQHDTLKYDIYNLLGYTCYRDSVRGKPKDQDGQATNTKAKLFWGFRYQLGSYKARKAGISHPSVMMKYKGDKFRLYGNAENNKLFQHCKDILKGWKARSKSEMRSLMPEYRAWLKANRLQARLYPFSYWLINVNHPKGA